MKYQAVAFVQGLEYARMAAYSIPRASLVLGHEVKLISLPPNTNIWLEKLSVIEEFCAPVLCLDVDLVLCNWDWSRFKLDRFNAVVDYPMIKWRHGARAIKEHYPVETSVNGGLWYAPYTSEVRAMFKRARELYVELKDFHYAFGDQAALNKAIHELLLPVNFLPLSFNHQVPMNSPKKLPEGTHVGHAIGQAFKVDDKLPNLRAKSARLIEMLEKNPPWHT